MGLVGTTTHVHARITDRSQTQVRARYSNCLTNVGFYYIRNHGHLLTEKITHPPCNLRPKPLVHITKTCLYNFDPLNPHFYIVKLGFRGVCIIFSSAVFEENDAVLS